MSNKTFLIALGGNIPTALGGPEATLHAGLEAIARREMRVVAQSRFYATPCFPKGAGPDYVNAAAIVQSALPEERLIDELHAIEAEFGREREQRWGQRTLDLDLLAAGDAVLPDLATYQSWQDLPLEAQKKQSPPQLILPHPRMHERAFVLVPLAEIAPDWCHPVLGQAVTEMLANLPQDDVAEVVPLAGN